MTKLDHYTVRFEFDETFRKFMSSLISWRGGEWGRFAPKHYLERWHIEKPACSRGYSPNSPAPAATTAHELVKEYWEDIGLQVLLKPGEYALTFERMEAGETEILSETEIFRKELREYNISPETIRWGSKWHVWLDADPIPAGEVPPRAATGDAPAAP